MNGGSPTPDDPCPDEAVIAAFAAGESAPDEVEAIEAHLDGCDACGRVVADMVRIFDDGASVSGSGAPAEPDPFEAEDRGLAHSGSRQFQSQELAVTLGAEDSGGSVRAYGVRLSAGSEVGRYRVLECVGVGGMGVVYAAYDPELDRRVALKLLRGGTDDPDNEGRNARLLREAQALAKVTHPNVITVHDVGTWEGQVFVAMEFVDGITLKTWCGEARRSWTEIRDVFVAAGRGLAAAHAVDLVHRDFKPDNVLIGHDGRVRVTDFGLARWGRSEARELVATDQLRLAELGKHLVRADDPISQVRTPMVTLTETGALMGTPAYMAPEQYEQRTADAASDQFSFCVALYEAIYRERPFAGRTLAELASNVLEGKISDPTRDGEVPRAVRQALQRGLSRQREDRFPSMDALLAVLDRRPAIRRWQGWALAAVPVLAVGVGLWASARATEASRSSFCRGERGLAGVWNAERKEEIRTALLANELPYAAETVERVLPALDAYAEQWEGLRTVACEPDPAAQEGPGVAALRERCLSRRRMALGALLEVFEEPDDALIGRAVGAVSGLPKLESCAEAESLLAELPPPVPPALRESVESVRDQLARAKGLESAGNYPDALALAQQADRAATELGHLPLQAETRLRLALVLDMSGDAEAAYEAFEDAALLATRSRHRRIAAQALVGQVYVLGMTMARIDEAERVARRAEAEIEGADMVDDALDALRLNQGSVAFRKADYDAAEAYFQEALALRDREREPMRWADAAFNLATLDMINDRSDRAIARIEDYLEVYAAELGRNHPEYAMGLQNLGVAFYNAKRFDEARRTLQEAERIGRISLGEEHPGYANTLNMMGSVEMADGKIEAGLVLVQRSLAIREASGADPAGIANDRMDVAEALLRLGRLDEAEPEIEAAMATIAEHLGAQHPQIGFAHGLLATIASARGDADQVREHMARTRENLTTLFGADDPQVLRVAVDEASLLGQAGARAEAIAALRAQLESLSREYGASLLRGVVPEAKVELGELLWDEPGGQAEAHRLMQQARREFETLEMSGRVTMVDTWVQAHPS